ncbi:OmpW/AlkL family protein [Zymobacter sp. IVIA_5232.4 C2]|uniref:OmpW/AlkL family protein n=1 Tax=Zymobacter sp. IVIA_5232.4 C2 TaxID=3394855 RepID=UPI0039C1287B
MKSVNVLAAAILAGSAVIGTQQAMAYTAGDLYFRGDFTRTNTTGKGEAKDGTSSTRLDLGTDRSSSAALGWVVADKFGFEFNSSTESLRLGNGAKGDSANGSKYHPYTLVANWFPLGGTGAQVQPYVGIGASYYAFSNRAADNLPKDKWAPTAQAGVDFFLTKWLAVNGYVQYSRLRVDTENDASEYKIDPLTVGAGLTFRF